MPYKDKAKKKAWYEANKEHRKAYEKARYEANKEEQRAKSRARYAANREERRATMRAYHAANPERRAAYKRKRQTGWTDEQYRSKLAEQGDRCGICGVEKCSTGRAFSADHCHKTGQRRGVLCAKCNTAIGKLGDNAAGVLKAAAYLLAYEVETKWEPITNDEHTIDTGAANHATHLQSPDERGRHDLRDMDTNDRPRNRAPALALVRGAGMSAR